MILSVRNGQSGVILRLKLLDSSRADGGGLTGLTASTSGLVIAAIADNEAAPTTYRASDGTIETIAALGTYASPLAGKCRFREVNPGIHPGIYEIHLDNARFAVAGARSLLISVNGATNMAECDAVVPLTVFDPYAVNGGFDPWAVSLPGVYAAGTAGARMGNLDASVSTRLAASAYAAAPSVAQVAAAVWDEPAATHTAAGSFGSRLDAAVSSRSTYSGGPVAGVTAPVTVGTNQDKSGYGLATASLDAIVARVWDEPASAHASAGSLGSRLDAAVSTRLAASAYAAAPSVAQVAAAVWDEPAATHTAAGSFGSRLDAAISSRSTYSGGPVAGVTAPVTVGMNLDKAGYGLSAAGLDAIAVEPGINARQAFAPILAALGGVVSGAGTGTITIKGANNASTTRITATTDSAGNRSAVTFTLPS